MMYNTLLDAIAADEISLAQATLILNEVAWGDLSIPELIKALEGGVCNIVFYEDCMTAMWDGAGPGHCIPIAVKEFDQDKPRVWAAA